MMKRLIAVWVAVMVGLMTTAAGQEFSVKVTINNVNNTVSIPDVPGGSFSSGGSVPTDPILNPQHYYLASYSDTSLIGLVAASADSIETDTDGSTEHSLAITQPLGSDARVLLAFTSGDWRRIDSVISLIEERRFLTQISPSFAFGLGDRYLIQLLLFYPGIDVRGDVELQRGSHQLSIRNDGIGNDGLPQVVVDVT